MLFGFLSTNQKDALQHEYHVRLIIVCIGALTILFVSGVVLLIPTLKLLNSLEHIAVRSSEVEDISLGISERETTEETLNHFSVLMNIYKQQEQMHPSTTIVRLIEQMPSTIQLSRISFSDDESKVTRFSVVGKANTRDALITYTDALRATGLFSEVTLPIENLAKEKALPFTLVLVPKTLHEINE